MAKSKPGKRKEINEVYENLVSAWHAFRGHMANDRIPEAVTEANRMHDGFELLDTHLRQGKPLPTAWRDSR